jgi:hypothetical protein
MATGVNTGSANPTFHGEIVAIDDYVARHGNRGWSERFSIRPASLVRCA